MRIPHSVTGRTRPSSQGLATLSDGGATAAAFGAGIGQGLQQLGGELQRRQAQLKAERAKNDQFEAKKIYAQESLYASEDLVRRQNEAPLGAEEFTSNLMSDYEKRHNEVLAGMRQRGFSEEVIQDAELNFYGMRQSLQGKGLTFEQNSYSAKVVGDVEDMGLSLSQLASMNPQEMEDSIALLEESIDQIPGLDAIAKDELKRSQRETIALAAGFGLAQQDPRSVVDMLAVPSGSGVQATELPSAAQQFLNAIAGPESGDRYDIRFDGKAGSRFTDFSDHPRVFEDIPGGFAAAGQKSSAAGRYQTVATTWDDIVANTGIKDFSPANQDRGNWWLAQRDYSSRTGGRSLLEDIEAGNYGQVRRGLAGTWEALRYMSDEEFAQQMTSAGKPKRGLSKPVDGKTGNPVLDALSPAQRSQVLNQAQAQLSQQQAQFRAGFEQNVENATAALMSQGAYAGVMPSQEDFFRAYEPIKAQQEWAKFQGAQQVGGFISDMKMMNPQEITAAIQSLEPRDTASPTYARELETYTKAREAATNVLDQRAKDPAGYVTRNYPAAAEAWQAGNMQLAFRTMEAAYDELGVPQSQRNPFPTSTVSALREQYNAQSAEGKLQWLGQLRTNAGSMYGNALNQLADGGMKVEAYLSGLMAQSPQHQQVAAGVLRGLDIIANDPSRAPAKAQAELQFRTAMSDAQQFLDPRASGAMLEAATALYIANGGDPKGIVPSEFNDAVRQVAGGLPDNPDTGFYDMDKAWGADLPVTILPPGVSSQAFESWKDGLTEEDFEMFGGERPQYRTGEFASASDISDGGAFVRVGPDRYIIMMNSDGEPLLNSQGQRYVLQVTPDAIR